MTDPIGLEEARADAALARRALLAAALAYGAAHAAAEAADETLALAPYHQETLDRLNVAYVAATQRATDALDALHAAYAAHARAGEDQADA